MGHQRDNTPHATVLDETTARAVATILQGLATPSRLRIIGALQAGPLPVTDIVDAVGMEQSAVSHQLRHLRDLGFVVADRQGRHQVYRLYDTHVLELLAQGLAHAEHLDLGQQQTEETPPRGVAADSGRGGQVLAPSIGG